MKLFFSEIFFEEYHVDGKNVIVGTVDQCRAGKTWLNEMVKVVKHG